MLAVDVGNTFTRLAAFDGDEIKARHSFPTRDLDIQTLRAAFIETAAFSDSPSVWVASVAPSVNATVDAAAERAGLSRRFIRSAADVIIPHRLSTPQTTGVDRLLSALAAGALHFQGEAGRHGYIVVQCGSAATVDMVDVAGVFLGGYIIPGPGLWLSGLAAAAQLPNLSGEPPDWSACSPGNNTREAILHGMAAALPEAVAAAVVALGGFGKTESPQEALPVAVTGGWGQAVLARMDDRAFYDRDLLLHGIRIFAERSGE